MRKKYLNDGHNLNFLVSWYLFLDPAVLLNAMQILVCANSMKIPHTCSCQGTTRSKAKVSAGTQHGSNAIGGWED